MIKLVIISLLILISRHACTSKARWFPKNPSPSVKIYWPWVRRHTSVKGRQSAFILAADGKRRMVTRVSFRLQYVMAAHQLQAEKIGDYLAFDSRQAHASQARQSPKNLTSLANVSFWPEVQRHTPLRWPAPASTAEDHGFECRLRRNFSGVKSYQWLKTWHSNSYPASRLAL